MEPETIVRIVTVVMFVVGVPLLFLTNQPGYVYFVAFLSIIIGASLAFADFAAGRMVKSIREYNMRPCTKCGAKRQEGESFYALDHWCPRCQKEFSDWLVEDDVTSFKCHVCNNWFPEWYVNQCGNFKACNICILQTKETDVIHEVGDHIIVKGKIYQRSCSR